MRIEVLRVNFARDGGSATLKLVDDHASAAKAGHAWLECDIDFLVFRSARPPAPAINSEVITIRGDATMSVLVTFRAPVYHAGMTEIDLGVYRRPAAMLIANIAVNATLDVLNSSPPMVVLMRG